jgi:hypothetical protein
MVPIWILSMGLTGSEVAVYVALRSFCDRNGECYPTMRTVATRAGCSYYTVRNALKRFRELDLLTTADVYRSDGQGLAHLRYHLIDLDPRQWSVEPREVTPDQVGGVTPTGDTPNPHKGHLPPAQVTQEHTNEHPIEHTNESPPPPSASSSSAKRAPRPRKTKTRTMTEEESRQEKINKRKSQERDRAATFIAERLGTDVECAEATVNHLCEVIAESGVPIRALDKYVRGIPDDELAGHHDDATWAIQDRRRAEIATLVEHLRKNQPKVSQRRVDEFSALAGDALCAGIAWGEIADALNATHDRDRGADFVTGYVQALERLLDAREPVAA